MLVPIRWLNEYVDIDVTPEELAQKLLSVGFEVEGIEYLGKDIKNVVVGKITKIEKHPDAEHLQICQVEVGENNGGVVQIVTGADNIFENAIIPVALVGAHLPNGIKIEKAKLRGVPSFGMMCSGGELNLTESDYKGAEVHGILILDNDAKVGQDIVDYLDLSDVVLDVSVTANRPDCQSIVGIAREAAAVLGKKFKYPNLEYNEDKKTSIKDYVDVAVKNSNVCTKYISKVVNGIKFIDTPKWMKQRLRAVGLRSIDIFVDITNYVMIELGQPMHAFDLENLENHKIVIRNANAGEKIKLLNDTEIVLDDSVLVIADGKKPIAIAGIMGGVNSGVNENTKTVVFESAKFLRDVIRKTSKKIGVRSDASSRFEKGVDVYTTEKAMKRALALVTELGCGTIVGLEYNLKSENIKNKEISCEIRKINDCLGIVVPDKKIVEILNLLDFSPKLSNGIVTCVIPNYREDVDNYTDLAEEVIRYYGYDHINGSMMPTAKITHGGYSDKQKYINDLKLSLVDKGYSEIYTYSFVSPKSITNLSLQNKGKLAKPIKILNPLGEDVSIMRTTLVHSMLEIMESNSKKSNDSAKLFEIANIFVESDDKTSELPEEIMTLCVGEYGEGTSFYTIKSALESVFEGIDLTYTLKRSNREFLHPGRSADVYVDDVCIGYFGEVHPDTIDLYEVPKRSLILEISLPYILKNVEKRIKFSEYSKFPPVERDLAIIVDDDVEMKDIYDIIENKGGKVLSDLKLFDVYKGEQVDSDKKSLAFRLKFSAIDKTLTDAEIEEVMGKIISSIERELGGKLR